MKRILLCAVFAIAVMGNSACSKDKISPAEAELLGCETYASALDQLAGPRENGKLSKGTIELVDHTRDTVDPICLGKAPDVNASVASVAVDAGTKALLAIVASLKL